MPEPTAEQSAALSRITNHAEHLARAIAELEAVGGLRALSASLKPAAMAKAKARLKTLREAIDAQLKPPGGKPPGGKPKGRPMPMVMPTRPIVLIENGYAQRPGPRNFVDNVHKVPTPTRADEQPVRRRTPISAAGKT